MSFLERLYPGDEAAGIALNVIVQIAVVATAAILLGRTAAKRNAALAHCILLVAFLWVIVSPLATWQVRGRGVALFHMPLASRGPVAPPANVSDRNTDFAPQSPIPNTALASSSKDERKSAVADLPERFASPQSGDAATISATPYKRFTAIVGAAELLWTGIALVLVMRVGVGMLVVRQIRRRAKPAEQYLFDEALAHACGVLGVNSLPQVLISDQIAGPAAVGIWNKAILIPRRLMGWMSNEQLGDVLIHEGIHAVRHDFAVGIVQRVVGAVLWFHPMVALLNREIRRKREEVCDNAVLTSRDPAGYSRTLLELSQRIERASLPSLLPAFFSRGWKLEERVTGILSQRRTIMTRVNNRTRLAVAATVIAISFVCPSIAVSHGQSALTLTRESTEPATMPATPLLNAASRESSLTLLGPDTAYISPDEVALRSRMDQARRAVQRAELGVKEAGIKTKAAQLDFDRKSTAYSNKTLASSELEEARLSFELTKIELDRASLGLEEARESAIPTREIDLYVWDGDRSEREQYTIRSLSLHAFISKHFKQGLDGNWVFSLYRGHTKMIFRFVRGISAQSEIGRQLLQAGDQILIRRDVVTIRKGTGPGAPVIHSLALNGRTMTLPQVLKEAGVRYSESDNDRRIVWTGPRWEVSNKQWSASLGDVARGMGKDDVVEPSDAILLPQ